MRGYKNLRSPETGDHLVSRQMAFQDSVTPGSAVLPQLRTVTDRRS